MNIRSGKTLLICVLSCWAVLSHTACTKKKKDAQPVDLANTIIFWEQEDKSAAPYLDSIIAEFQKDNAGIKVLRSNHSGEDLVSALGKAAKTPESADVILGFSDDFEVLMKNKLITSVDGFFDPVQFLPKLTEIVTRDGKIWGVPNGIARFLMLYYNREYVKSAPATTNELVELCEQLIKTPLKKDPKKMLSCIAFPASEPLWLLPFISGFGGWPLDELGNPALNTEPVTKAMDFALMLKNKGYIPADCGYKCMDTMYREGSTAMIINGEWAAADYMNVHKENAGISLLPVVSDTGIHMGPAISGRYLFVSSSANPGKIDRIKKFTAAFNSLNNQARLKAELKRLPALNSLYVSSDVAEQDPDPYISMMIRQIELGKDMTGSENMRKALGIIKTQYPNVLQGKSKPAEIAGTMQEQVSK